MLIDTHAHIDMQKDPIGSIERAFEAGVERIIIPAADPEKFDEIIKLIDKYEHVYGQMGVHPSDAQKFSDTVAKRIIELAGHKKVVAIGEIGLDYYWDKSFVDVQKRVLKTQIEIAHSLDLPIVVHSREAFLDTFEILEQMEAKNVLLHCYSGSLEFAHQCMKKGWFFSLGGVVTFKNAKKAHIVAKEIPLEHLMLETDCPYLAPVPYRGQENEPAYVNFVAKEIANIKDKTLNEVARATTANAKRFFRID